METNIDPAAGVIVKSDQTGRARYAPEYKREVLAAFECSTFSWPQDIDGDRRKLVIKPTALAMLTDGIDLRDGFQRP